MVLEHWYGKTTKDISKADTIIGDNLDSRSTIQGMIAHSKWKNPNHPLHLRHSDQPGAIPQDMGLIHEYGFNDQEQTRFCWWDNNETKWKQSWGVAAMESLQQRGQYMAARFHVERDFRERHQLQGRSTNVYRFAGKVLTCEYSSIVPG